MKLQGTFFSSIVGMYLALAAASAQAGPYPLPSLKLSQLSGGQVLVRWSISGGVIAKRNKLQIGRSDLLLGAFPTIKEIKNPARKGRFVDDPGMNGIAHYFPAMVLSRKFLVSTKVFSISLDGVPYTPGQGEPSLAAGQSSCPAGSREELLRLVNVARTAGVLAFNAKLQWAAQAHAIEIANAGTLTIAGIRERIAQTGFTAHSYTGVAYEGGTTASQAVDAWLQQGGSGCDNLLYESLKNGAGGCVVDSSGTMWWTFAMGE